MKRVAIIYGPQGCGKTRIHAPVLKSLGYDVVHETNEPGDILRTGEGADIYEATGDGRLVPSGKGLLV